MTETKLPCLELNRYADKRLREKHPWVFSNEIADMKRLQALGPGAFADVLDCHGNYVGTGFTNPNSLIAIRLLTRNRTEHLDESFFIRRFLDAISLRERIYGEKSPARGTYRAVFGESDGLPGLIVDRFGPLWVLEPHALGMAMQHQALSSALKSAAEELLGEGACTAIILRTDNRAAALEGMEAKSELVFGALPTKGVFAVEGNIEFPVDPLAGQKTGFFFDQRENRAAFVRTLPKKARVLDAYCHLGAWGLQALAVGAAHVTFLDQSESALAAVKSVAAARGWTDRAEFILGDALPALQKMKEHSFDAIALDPPAFITSKKTAVMGLKAYADNNAAAVRLLKSGGILSSSSCSYHCQEDRFEAIVGRAALDANRSPRVIYRGGAALDHPFLAGMPESRYLKNLLLAL